MLQDASGELELKCSLQESLRRARTRPLFTVSQLELKYRNFIILLGLYTNARKLLMVVVCD